MLDLIISIFFRCISCLRNQNTTQPDQHDQHSGTDFGEHNTITINIQCNGQNTSSLANNLVRMLSQEVNVQIEDIQSPHDVRAIGDTAPEVKIEEV